MRKSYHKTVWILLFLASGILAGCAAPKLFRMGSGSYAGFTSLYSFSLYEKTTPSFRILFPYLISVRFPAFLILWMSSFTTMGLLFHLLYAWWLLASAAMLLSLFLLRDGAQGILLFFCCIFPQWFFYLSCLKKELAAWADRGRRAEAPGRDLAVLTELCAVLLAGCACEAFLGTWTLQIYLRMG